MVAEVTFWELGNCHYCRWLVTPMLEGRQNVSTTIQMSLGLIYLGEFISEV